MNDYFAGFLARERHADALREVEHDELVAQVHRATDAKTPVAGGTSMTLRRLVASAVAAIALVIALTAPVAADNGSYPGCSNFGAVQTGAFAPHGALGALVSSIAPTGPGALSAIVQAEHGDYCAPH